MPSKKVLIVDKNQSSRGYLAKTLELMRHTVEQTSLGKEGLILTWGGRPDLIIVDPTLDDLSGEEMLTKLRKDARSANIPAIAWSADNNPVRKTACLQAGFNQYLVKSMDTIPTLLDVVNQFLEDKPIELEDDKSSGLLIVFLSSKGGVGTSTLCANLGTGIGATQTKSRIAVVDAVLPIGSIASIAGYGGGTNLPMVCALEPNDPETLKTLKSLPKPEGWEFHLLAGCPDPQSALKLQSNRIESVVRSIKNSYDFVLVDIGRALSRISLPLIKQADLIVLVTGNDMNTVELTKIVCDYLAQQGVTSNRLYAVLNRAVGLEGLTKPQIEEKLQLKVQTALPYAGENFAVANNQHAPIVNKFPNHIATMILQEAAKGIVLQAKKVRDRYTG